MHSLLLALAAVPAFQDVEPVDVTKLTDAALEEHFLFERRSDHKLSDWPPFYEDCLNEMARRGGDRWAAVLQTELEQVRREVTVTNGHKSPADDLEVLTALRRAQGKRDPLKVAVQWEGTPLFEFPELPVFALRLENDDEEGESFGFTIGGDYRSGRLARWTVEITDAAGEDVRRPVDWPWGVGGGIFNRAVLAAGASWGAEPFRHTGDPEEPRPLLLPMREYALPTRPGSLVARVVYHDRRDLTYVTEPQPFVYHRSAPLPFEWAAREVTLTAAEVHELRELIEDLYAERVYLLSTPWSPARAPEEGETAAELLYNRGYDSLPLLLESLVADERTPEQRARLFAMLFSLTGLHDPRGARGSLGECRYTGRRMTGGGEMGGGTWRDQGPDPEIQAPLVERWKALAPMVRLKVVE